MGDIGAAAKSLRRPQKAHSGAELKNLQVNRAACYVSSHGSIHIHLPYHGFESARVDDGHATSGRLLRGSRLHRVQGSPPRQSTYWKDRERSDEAGRIDGKTLRARPSSKQRAGPFVLVGGPVLLVYLRRLIPARGPQQPHPLLRKTEPGRPIRFIERVLCLTLAF